MSRRTIFRMLNKASDVYKDNNYLSQKDNNGWVSTSYSEVRTKAIQLASAFIEHGLVYKDKIAILSEAKTNWVISEFATLYTGSISVPLSIK